MLVRLSVMLCALFLSACSITQPLKSPEISKYTLNSVSHKRMPGVAGHKTLLVSNPAASPGYYSSAMIYTKNPYQLQQFSRNAWVASPSQMMKPLLADSMRNSGIFHAVIAGPFTGITDYRLDTTIAKLQQEFQGSQSRVRLVLDVSLVNVSKSKVVSSRRIEIVERASQANPYKGVVAANRATQKAMDDIVAFVAGSLRQRAA